MSGNSNVGSSAVYQADDQRTESNAAKQGADFGDEGKENSHQANDSSKFESSGGRDLPSA
jgi:hypothetical protein